MRVGLKFLFIPLLLIFHVLTANAQIIFQTTIGALENEERLYGVQQTDDGGYISTGYTQSFGEDHNAYVVKFDRTGGLEWSRVIGGPGNDRGREVRQTADGGYVIAGYTGSYGPGVLAAWLIKMDDEGNVEWSKAYGGDGDDRAFDIEITADGGYILAGYGNSNSSQNENDFYLVKTDADGETEWENYYGGPGEERAYSVYQTADGGYVVSGRTNSYGAGDDDVYLVKVDEDGIIEWTSTFGGEDEDRSYSVIQTNDEGFAILGRTLSFGTQGIFDAYLIKTDNNGNPEWSKIYGDEFAGNIGRDIKQTEEGDFVLVGYHTRGEEDVLFGWKVDNQGALIWESGYGGTERDRGFSVNLTDDKGYVFGGYSASPSNAELEYYIIKTDEYGNSGCNAVPVQSVVSDANTQTATGGVQSTVSDPQAADLNVNNHGQPSPTHQQVRELCCNPVSGFNYLIDNELEVSFSARIADADNYTWDLGDGNTAGDPNFTHTYDETDTYEVCLIVELSDCSNQPEQLCKTVDLVNNSLTGSRTEQSLTVYPNPVSDKLNIDLPVNNAKSTDVVLFNSAGQAVLEQTHKPGQNSLELDAGSFPPGLYMMQVRSGDKVYSEKILVK